MNVWIGVPETPDARRQPVAGQCSKEPYAQAGPGLAAVELPTGFVDNVESSGYVLKVTKSRFRRYNAPMLTDEQLAAEALLENSDVAADRACRNTHFIGGTGDVFMAGCGFERPQGVQWWQAIFHCGLIISAFCIPGTLSFCVAFS